MERLYYVWWLICFVCWVGDMRSGDKGLMICSSVLMLPCTIALCCLLYADFAGYL